MEKAFRNTRYLVGMLLITFVGVVIVCWLITRKQGHAKYSFKVTSIRRVQPSLQCIAMSDKTELLAIGYINGRIEIRDIDSNEIRKTMSTPSKVNSIVFNPEGELCAAGGDDGIIRIWETRSWKLQHELQADAMVLVVKYDSSGKLIAGKLSGEIDIWDLTRNNKRRVLRGHDEQVVALSVSPVENIFASASSDGTINIWNTSAPERLLKINDSDRNVSAITFNANGELLIEGCEDGVVRVWKAENGQQLSSWDAHSGGVRHLLCSQNGGVLVSAGYDRKVNIWASPGWNKLASCIADSHSSVDVISFGRRDDELIAGFEYGVVKLLRVSVGRVGYK